MLKSVTSSFADLGLRHEIVGVLTARGIHSPFPVQELTIPDALEGLDVCGKAKTGSGKTLAFGLPVLQRMKRARPKFPTGLVLVPTRELASQVRDELAAPARAVNRKVLAVYGGASMEKQIEKLKSGVDLVVATPGRMIDLIERQAVSVEDVAHVVVDEADRMADMGFLPQVEWILRNVRSNRQTLLFSATLDGVVNSLIRRYQHDPVMHEVAEKEITAKEMTHRFIAVHKMDKSKVAAAIARSADRTIMFTSTKVMADRLARDLVQIGVKAAAIHGDLRQSNREKSLRDFANGKLRALVATDVAARGIHVDDIDIVVHYDPPSDHKTYLHRAGRTARAGETGLVVTLSVWDEELEIKRLQKRIDVVSPLTEMFSNDERLADLAGWDPTAA
ncbi:MAG: DEAD/DEAH box helicase [Acidimicrobiaceae bacterium]|nr:DEAD/DEAH box helicase [Acidimicrobiaceae bacterium]MDE0608217.1 DEAD/DEAH box helicase [Acidimicrobiaceae bacterium]